METPPEGPQQGPYQPQYQQPYYPPYQQPYMPPPSRGSSTVAWIGVALGGLAVLIAAGAFLLFAFGGYDDGYYDEEYDDGYETFSETVSQPCEDMLAAGEKIELFVPPETAAPQIEAFAATGREIVAALDENDPDGYGEYWRDQWVTLLDALDEYTEQLAAGEAAEFEEPTDERVAITTAMSWEAPEGCIVPPVIASLDRTPPPGEYDSYAY